MTLHPGDYLGRTVSKKDIKIKYSRLCSLDRSVIRDLAQTNPSSLSNISIAPTAVSNAECGPHLGPG